MAKSVAKWSASLVTAAELQPGDHFRWRTTQKGVSVVVDTKKLDDGLLRVRTKEAQPRDVDPTRQVVLYVEPTS